MSGETYRLMTLKQALETLGLDRESFWEKAQAAEARLLLPLPSGAVLQAQDETITAEPKTAQGFCARQRFRTELPLVGMDYFVPASAHLVDIGKLPEVACDHVTHVAARLPGQAAVSVISIGESINGMPSMSLHDKIICKAVPLGLWLSGNDTITLGAEQAYLVEEDVERIRSQNLPHYPPGIEDYGAFQPSEHTTRMICEMNTAYHLFRVKHPIDPNDPEAKERVQCWFDVTWNGEERAKDKDYIGQDVLIKAAEVILQSNRDITIGRLTIQDGVKQQHAKGAPDILMLMEQLAQDRAVWKKSGQCPGAIRFINQSTLEDGLKKIKVGPDRYVRLIKRILDPSR